MADLPDLNTDNVGFIAYWNAIDQGGAGSINPSEITSNGNLDNITYYDNGIEGEYTVSYSAGTSRTFSVRCKTDGWLVVYIDRRNEFVEDSESGHLHGYWDVVHDWTDVKSIPDTRNRLEIVISDLQTEFSNNSLITYNSGDVGLYNYEYSGSNLTHLSGQSSGPDWHGSYATTKNMGFLYTSETSIKYAASAGAAVVGADINFGHSRIRFEGVNICDTANASDYNYVRAGVLGSRDIFNNGLMPDPGTEYILEVTPAGNGDSSDKVGYGVGTSVIIWD